MPAVKPSKKVSVTLLLSVIGLISLFSSSDGFGQSGLPIIPFDNTTRFIDLTDKLQYATLEVPESELNDYVFGRKLIADSVKNNNVSFPNHLYLSGILENKSDQECHMVFSTSRRFEGLLIQFGQKDTLQIKIGENQPRNKIFSPENRTAVPIHFLPGEQKTIVFYTIQYSDLDTLKYVRLASLDHYEKSIISFYRNNYNAYVLLALLIGGLLMMFIYHFFIFLKTQKFIYLHYAFYIFFSFTNLFLLVDITQFFLGGSNRFFFPLVQEITYVLAIVFYIQFIQYLFEDANARIKKILKYYTYFLLLYICYLVIFFVKWPFVMPHNVLMALIFRVSAIFVSFYVLISLLKNYQKAHIKYFFIGSLIMVFSYTLHVVFNLIYGPKLINHYFNALGTIVEVLLFTYGLYLKIQKEANEKLTLETIHQLRTHFFNNISHEFRTPLTLIKSPLQSLQSAEINVEKQKQLRLIDQSTNRLMTLVDQLMALSNLEANQMQFLCKKLPLNSFFESLVEPFSYQAQEKNINFKATIQLQITAWIDQDIVEKIINNLLGNALKYTPEGKDINFEAIIVDGCLKMTFTNTGVVLAQENPQKLFERFYQENIQSDGAGIGLAFTKQLVTGMRGEITVNYIDDQLQFEVLLPVDKEVLERLNTVFIQEEDEYKTTMVTSGISSEKPLLLVVDDNSAVREVLKNLFQDHLQVIEAVNGKMGYEIAVMQIPDIIITDAMMPEMDGYALAKALKSNMITSFIPVFMLTAKAGDDAHLKALNYKIEAYFSKPFNHQLLLEKVLRFLEARSLWQEEFKKTMFLAPVIQNIPDLDKAFLDKAQKIMETQLSNSDFSVDDFASQLAMSRMQLHRKLKSLSGFSATAYIKNFRLKTAKAMLDNTDLYIADVAYAVGFNNAKYFSKCYKEHFGVLPRQH